MGLSHFQSEYSDFFRDVRVVYGIAAICAQNPRSPIGALQRLLGTPEENSNRAVFGVMPAINQPAVYKYYADGSGITYAGDGSVTSGTVTSWSLAKPDGTILMTTSGFAPISAVTFSTNLLNPSLRYAFLVSLMDDDTTITGAVGGDIIETGAGNDVVTAGDDGSIVNKWAAGNLSFTGGLGTDTLSVRNDNGSEPLPPSGLVVDLAAGTGTNPYGGTFTLVSVENVVGSRSADTIDGSGGDNIIGAATVDITGDDIETFAGDDTVYTGFDATGATVDAGADSDNLFISIGGNGTHRLDLLNQANNSGLFAGGTFANFETYGIMSVSNGNFTFNFNGSNSGESISIRGGTQQNITLNGGADTLEHLFFVPGSIAADGGAGTDTLRVFGFSLSVLDLGNFANNTELFADFTSITGFEIYEITGGSMDFRGSGAAETANGAGGDDILSGGGGNDTLNGNDGVDVLTGGAGDDTLSGGGGNAQTTDTAVFLGNFTDYIVSFDSMSQTVTLTDTRGGSPDGTDTVTGVELFRFNGVTRSLADTIGQGPNITSPTSVSIAENTIAVLDVQASHTGGQTEGSGLTYRLITPNFGGAEDGAGLFTINATTGVLSFFSAPDFETPQDANGDNVYKVTVRVTDSDGITDDQTFMVTVTDVVETTGPPGPILGTPGPDTLTGTDLADFIFGFAGADQLFGLGGDDILTGGTGRDRMTGGTGADDFDFNSKSETGKTAAKRDVITDFERRIDDIDLKGIDANSAKKGDQKFTFINKAAFHHKAGELHYFKIDAKGTAHDKTIVEGDINGDGRADFQIELLGLHTLTKGDFVL